jgi:indole-3-glycerol phosphate synthase
MSDTLSEIIAYKRDEVAVRKAARPPAAIEDAARNAPPVRPFADALAAEAKTGLALIAEIKKASPSRGLIRADFDVPALAKAYADGGAACLSVLTDEPSFQGRDLYLQAARGACPLPVLRKDFMIDAWQVAESRALGADAILIIMAAVSDALARELAEAAAAWKMDALVECHDEAEVERALALPGKLIGINNRDLRTFKTDIAVTERLAPMVPRDRLLVAESGLFTHADLKRLAGAGAGAFLIGEALMRQADVTVATKAILGRYLDVKSIYT